VCGWAVGNTGGRGRKYDVDGELHGRIRGVDPVDDDWRQRRGVDLHDRASNGCAATATDVTKLPLGDGKYSTSVRSGYVYSCIQQFNGGGAFRDGPWIDANGKTWDKTRKIAVQGSVTWPSQFGGKLTASTEDLSGNGYPSTPTGTFPVASGDPAYQYDRNPNSVKSYTLAVSLPANPQVASSPTCVGGTIGVSVLGAPIYSAFDAGGRDAAAHEVQDSCDGHPQMSGQYHFHSLSSCFTGSVPGFDAGLFGYALDGFGIYVERDASGKLPSSSDLDECHGRVSTISWHGQKVSMYHYVATDDFPYLVACYRGTPITSATGLGIR
jgi:hypothetical protein